MAGRCRATAVSMGNPHVVLFLAEDEDLGRLGRAAGRPLTSSCLPLVPEPDQRRVRARRGRRGPCPGLGAGLGPDDGLRHGCLRGRWWRRGHRRDRPDGVGSSSPVGCSHLQWDDGGPVLLTGPAVARVRRASWTRPGCGPTGGPAPGRRPRATPRTRSPRLDEGGPTDPGAPALPVRRAGPEDRREARRGRGRHLARRRRPRPPDAPPRGRRAAAGRRRPGDPPLPLVLGAADVP